MINRKIFCKPGPRILASTSIWRPQFRSQPVLRPQLASVVGSRVWSQSRSQEFGLGLKGLISVSVSRIRSQGFGLSLGLKNLVSASRIRSQSQSQGFGLGISFGLKGLASVLVSVSVWKLWSRSTSLVTSEDLTTRSAPK